MLRTHCSECWELTVLSAEAPRFGIVRAHCFEYRGLTLCASSPSTHCYRAGGGGQRREIALRDGFEILQLQVSQLHPRP
eukprot:2747513-Rhodomonas_salina.1